jgi:uncharacterized membrane protein
MPTLSLFNQMEAYTIAGFLFLIMIIAFLIGNRIRRYKERKGNTTEDKSIGALEGSLLGLLALLLSFTFSMSSSRHDRRVNIIIEEANDIGTAVLRADLYPDSIRQAFRKDFEAYVENRISFYEAKADWTAVNKSLNDAQVIQASLWERASSLGRDKENLHRTAQMIPALNAMIDITTTRTAATIDKVPVVIFYLLFLICLTAALMVGYSSGVKPDWTMVLSFSLMISMTVYLIIDLDRPRRGVITMDTANDQIVQLRSMFKDK